MRVRQTDSRRGNELADQGRLDLPELPRVDLVRRRLWIVASESPLEISSRHHYFFVDSERGRPLFSSGDLFLLRTSSGKFVLFAPRVAGTSLTHIKTLCEELANRIALACTQPGARSPIHEMLVLSSKAGRRQGRAGAAQERRKGARTPLEIALFRLAMMPTGSHEPSIVSALGERVLEGAHLLIPSLFHREYADASASFYQRTHDASFADEALAAYMLAARDFHAIGLHHQWRASLQNARSVAAAVHEPLLPGFEPAARPGHSIGFSAERLCGFSIALDGVETPSDLPATGLAQLYQAWGEVPLSDPSLLAALAGLVSPSRRLLATAQLRGEELSITAGVFDEMRALLRVDLEHPAHDDVAAIHIMCRSVRFEGAPWTMRPHGAAVFTGRAQVRRRHRLSVRATMLRGTTVYLNFEVRADEHGIRHYS